MRRFYKWLEDKAWEKEIKRLVKQYKERLHV